MRKLLFLPLLLWHLISYAAPLPTSGIGPETQLTRQLKTNSTPEKWIIAIDKSNVKWWGAVGDGVTDDTTSIQAALDHRASVGGGRVYVPAGTYYTTSPLIVTSYVHFAGEGRGKSIIQPTRTIGCVYNGNVCAVIATIGATNPSITGLTIDKARWTNTANGIALQPTGTNQLTIPTGAPTADALVSDCEIVGSDSHQYLIWNFGAVRSRILNNYIDGRVATNNPSSNQDGIEVYGGEDVLVQGNSVRNIGSTAIWTFSDATTNSFRRGVRVVNNFVDRARYGLGSQNVSDATTLQYNDNILRNLWVAGINITSEAGVRLRDIHITGNSVSGITNGNGIVLISSSLGSATNDSDIVISGNTVEFADHGVLVSNHSRTRVDDNTISSVTNGIKLISSSSSGNYNSVCGNQIVNVQQHAIWLYDQVYSEVKNNILRDYNLAQGGYFGVYVYSSGWASIGGNEFDFGGSFETNAIHVDAQSYNVTIGVNPLAYEPVLATPFLNLGSSPLGPYAYLPIYSRSGTNSVGILNGGVLSLNGVAPQITSDTNIFLSPGSGIVQLYNGSSAFVLDLYNDETIANRLNANGSSWINGGNFGVNTNTPFVLFHVNGVSRSEGSFTTMSSGGGSLADTIVFGLATIDPSLYSHAIQASLSGGGLNQMAFLVSDGGGSGGRVRAMTLDKTGLVSTRLSTADGTGVNTALKLDATFNTANDGAAVEFTSNLGAQKLAKIAAVLRINDQADLVFSTGNGADSYAERFRVAYDTGFLGIGTNSPQDMLHVHGSVRVTNDVYDATVWDGNLQVPTKDAVRDKIESLVTGSGIATNAGTGFNNTFTNATLRGITTVLTNSAGVVGLALNTNNARTTLDVVGGVTINPTYEGSSSDPPIIPVIIDANVPGWVQSNRILDARTNGLSVFSITHEGKTYQRGLSVGVGTNIVVMTNMLYASATLDFPSTLAQTDSDLAITVAGAKTGDLVTVGAPIPLTGSIFSGFTSNDTVFVRYSVYGLAAKDPASAVFKICVTQFQLP